MNEVEAEVLVSGTGHFLNALRTAEATYARRTAILYKGRSVSYGELGAQAKRWAARFQQLGIEPGDRVAILTGAKLPFLAAHLGVLYAGAVSLPINPRSTADELRYFLSDSGARV